MTTIREASPDVAPFKSRRPQSSLQIVLRSLLRNKGAVTGFLALLIITLTTLFAPYLATHDPVESITADSLQAPSLTHLMGTDVLGRDIFSRIVYGARISLRLGFVSVAIAASIGIALGLQSGYLGSWVDLIIMRVMDVMLAFPGLLLAMAIVASLGFSLTNAMIAVGISAVPGYTRVVRGSVLAARENLYVDAARVIGCRNHEIMFRHILPNVVAPLLVLATLGIGQAIITGSALSFLGLGAQPPTPEWGAMLNHGREYLRRAWWVTTFPGAAIMVTVLSINLFGDGLRDALDPRIRM